MRFLRGVVDNSRSDSVAAWFRRRRFAFFRDLLSSVPRPLRILDVGGTQRFWDVVEPASFDDVVVVLLNRERAAVSRVGFESRAGDARDMPELGDSEFDVVFSNSVIEHVGEQADQRRMANEVRRVGKRYFIQTPNRAFPVEPHFLVPFFQFLPVETRARLLTRFRLGWYPRIPDLGEAREVVASIRLLYEAELRDLFPEATIYRERVVGLTKSITAYAGW